MALWFFLVVTSFLFIWRITTADEIPDSMLALLGIGSGTALGAAAIDAGKGADGAAAAQMPAADLEKHYQSEGFLRDILSDGRNGAYSFHRFQILIWTLVLALLFVHSVWERLAMPEFSATLLMLQGISAGTYLGFKIPEKSLPAAPANPET